MPKDFKNLLPCVMSLLLTPGPLTTSFTVKRAAFKDMSARDSQFKQIIKSIREKLLDLAQVNSREYTTVLIPGSGTMGVESVINSLISPDDKLLVVSNGAYGERIQKMCQYGKLPHDTLRVVWNKAVSAKEVMDVINERPDITAVAMVHSETTSGLVNPVEELGPMLRDNGIIFIVDAMSSFGGIPLDIQAAGINFLISSANKCIQGIPGFSWVLAQRNDLLRAVWARTLSLDLLEQWARLETHQEFRFTPPVQAVLAFNQALIELEQETIPVRHKRYSRNQQVVSQGLCALGFELYLDPKFQGPIITTFKLPTDMESFDFQLFYEYLKTKGFVIYAGKLTQEPTFRVGSIGHIYEGDTFRFVEAVHDYCKLLNDIQAPALGI